MAEPSAGERAGERVRQFGCALTMGCLSLAALVVLVMWAVAYVRG